MSYQHFYSRVPARVSLYNKIDGFDTFAHSGGLNREFILGELSEMYRDKLRLHEPLRVRRDEVPTVYSQSILPSGSLVQTSIKYLPLDFTGERSAYIAHSLVISDDERDEVYSACDASVFNIDMFITDIASFDITAKNAMANPRYPELEYLPGKFYDPAEIFEKYNPDMVRSFLFALVRAICSEDQTVFFRLPCKDKELSVESTAFINAVLALLPYSLRQRLSFVSYVSEPEHYPGFKLKCVGEDCNRISVNKGSFYDFSTGTVTGEPDDLVQNMPLATFLHSLIGYKHVRDDFHRYVDGIEQERDSLALDIPTLSEMMYVFWQCSALYVEESILPDDDSLRRFFDIYAKYRVGIDYKYRMQAYRCLKRYPAMHIAIPEDIFERISTLYPEECIPAKAVALDVLLSLIHVDAMREELFDFMRRNYDSEIDAVKAVVNGNLCRVFYGGFLQRDILAFFDRNFNNEPQATRDQILDKLLLSIRTPEISRQIVSFLNKHYRSMNAPQRLKIYSTCIEMIPECDALSVYLISLINKHIAGEGEDLRGLVERSITEQLDLTVPMGDMRLLTLLIDNAGFCEDITLRHIWVHHMGIEALPRILAGLSAHKRAAKLVRMYKTLVGITDAEYEALVRSFEGMEVRIEPSNMYELMQVDRMAGLLLPKAFGELVREIVIYPTITETFLDVFKIKYGKDGIDALLRYAEGKSVLTDSPAYRTVENYIALTKAAEGEDVESVFTLAKSMPEEAREDIAEHIRVCSLDSASQTEVTACTYELLMNYFKTGYFGFDQLYSDYTEYFVDQREEGPGASRAHKKGGADAMQLLLTCIGGICAGDYILIDSVLADESGLSNAMSDFIELYGIGAGMFVKQKGKECPDEISELCDELIKGKLSSVSSPKEAMRLFVGNNKGKE